MILRKSLFILILRQCQYRLVGGWICGDTHLLRRVIGEKLQSAARLITAQMVGSSVGGSGQHCGQGTFIFEVGLLLSGKGICQAVIAFEIFIF